MPTTAAMLLLADGRLPAGGYAHSGGLEATVRLRGLQGAADVERFLEGRAATAGFVAAAFAAAACAAARAWKPARLDELDREFDARTPSPATRAVSRTLGRQLRRAVTRIHPHPLLDALAERPHQAIVRGVAAAAFDLAPREAAQIALHESAAGPAAAAAKVLSVDPFAVYAALARLAGCLDELADAAAACADAAPEELPALGAPLLDIAAEYHRSLDVRLFAS